jgi:hypothetical protein
MTKFKVGDTVRCVSNRNVGYHLVYSQEYKVEALYDYCVCVSLNNNSQMDKFFEEDRFELVSTPEPQPPTYIVDWLYKGNEGSINFDTKKDALGFTSMFHDDVPYSVTKDVDVDVGGYEYEPDHNHDEE